MKKKTLTALALGAATVATGMASNAHADNVTVTKQQVGDETEVITTTTKTDATQQQINQTKQAVAQQQAVVNKDESSVASAQSQVNQDVANASSAKSNVNQKSANLSSLQSAISSAQKHQPTSAEIQQNRNDQASMSSKVAQDQSKVSSQQAVVNQASQKQTVAQSNYDQAHSKVVADQEASSQYQRDQSIVDNWHNTQQADQSNVAPSIDLSSAQGLMEYLEDGCPIDKDNEEFNKDWRYMNDYAKNDDGKDITIPYNNNSVYVDRWDQAINDTKVISDAIARNNEDTTPVDYSTLYNGQQAKLDQEINSYGVALINSIRTQFNLTPVQLTTESIDFANQVADQAYENYVWPSGEHGWAPMDLNHNKAKVQDLANENGISSYAENLYEDPTPISTIGELKNAVLEGILHWISDDYDYSTPTHMYSWEHAKSLLDPNAKYIGLSFFKENSTKYPDLSFVMNAEIIDSEIGTETPVQQNNQDQLQQDKQAYEDALSRLPQEQQAINNLPNDEQQEAAAQQELTNANQALAAANNQLDQLQQQYNADQQKLSQLVDQGKQYQQQLDLLHNATSLLQNAHDEYNAAVQNYNQAVTKENQDRAMLAQLQHDYDVALNKLNELQAELHEEEHTTSTTSVQWIKNPVTTTADLGNVVSLTPSVDNDQANAGSSSEVVNNNQKNNSDATVNNTKVTVNTNTSKKAASVVSEKSNKKTVAVTPHVALQADDANVVHADTVQAVKAAKESANENVISFTTAAPTSVVNASASEENSMPQTGETSSSKTSLWGAISLAAAGILSTLGLADRKHRN